MKRFFVPILVAALCVSTLAGCSGDPIKDAFVEQQLENKYNEMSDEEKEEVKEEVAGAVARYKTPTTFPEDFDVMSLIGTYKIDMNESDPTIRVKYQLKDPKGLDQHVLYLTEEEYPTDDFTITIGKNEVEEYKWLGSFTVSLSWMHDLEETAFEWYNNNGYDYGEYTNWYANTQYGGYEMAHDRTYIRIVVLGPDYDLYVYPDGSVTFNCEKGWEYGTIMYGFDSKKEREHDLRTANGNFYGVFRKSVNLFD